MIDRAGSSGCDLICRCAGGRGRGAPAGGRGGRGGGKTNSCFVICIVKICI